MQSDQVWFLPWWLVVGVFAGLVVAVLIAGVFVAGSRLFPDERRGPTAGGETRKRAEIRRYLGAIDEEFVESYELSGTPIEFYLPKRDVAITFDARVFFRIEPTATHAVLVEHEMPGVHLGRRLPFETPDLTAGPDTDEPTRTAFAVLGLPTDASRAEVRAAYRRKVKRVHPDHGGDSESFNRVKTAYTVAREHASESEAETTPPSTA
ncbi:J domain-containing protein [Halalkalicoccus subterraneus]|uniref:J domain-containing protein n=1 Tax=Halalkalicoccus subterraneus TaxID=2675002 RepID=UPI000EFBC6FD|nr:J domain-containing protein [Halalkalicoccus subterraneus]